MSLNVSLNEYVGPLLLRSVEGAHRVLTDAALEFLEELDEAFTPTLQTLLKARKVRQQGYDAGQLPSFLPETEDIRQNDWQVAPVPDVLSDRRVEITGPVDRKMMINALNSGARVFMADFEDASAPRFDTMIAGQVNLLDYRDGTLSFDDPKTGKSYRVNDSPALLIVRPRGFHLEEAHVLINGRPIPAALFDFGLHFFHNALQLAEMDRGPFYYLPKLENHREARLWNEIFVWSQERVGLPQGTVKATVLIETLRAAFEMDEIIWELRDHIAGLNCGRWDYIFSYIKTLRGHGEYVLPDRADVTMDQAFLRTYAERLVQVCHRRGIHAMGGMAAQIPVRNDEVENAKAFEKVRFDKLREVSLGHDGTWVAHPALVPVALSVFDAHLSGPHQIGYSKRSGPVEEADLLEPHKGVVTECGVCTNISVAIEYLSQWLCGRGAVPINNMMEDAATAEICRAQLWQWIRYGVSVRLEEGGTRVMSAEWFGELLQMEVGRILDRMGTTGFHAGHYASAVRLLHDAVTAETLPDFITPPAYEVLKVLD